MAWQRPARSLARAEAMVEGRDTSSAPFGTPAPEKSHPSTSQRDSDASSARLASLGTGRDFTNSKIGVMA
ncbi:MAG: hypothetical protein V4633_25235 [Pseudomonadota bacterium]